MISDADLCRLSDAVYLPWPEVPAVIAPWGFELVGYCDHADTEAMLARRGDAWALVFRGTEASRLKVTDLAANVPGWPTLWAGPGRAHPGYERALGRIGLQVARIVGRRDPLWVTGHSMGGALAHLFGALSCTDLSLMYRPAPAAVVSFGAPAVFWGRAAARRAIPCPVHRYTLAFDPAPLVPVLFDHPAPAIRLPAPAGGPWLPWRRALWAHSPATYLAALTAAPSTTAPSAAASATPA